MGEDFLDRLIKPERPANPSPTIIPAGRDATAYALAALKGEVDNLLAIPVGQGRNHQLNIASMKMGQLVAVGAIDERTVVETLGAADGGLDYPATRKTIESGLKAGMTQGRVIPERTVPLNGAHRTEVAPWERSDDPFSDNYAAPPTAPLTAVAPDVIPTAETTDPAYEALVVLEARTQRLRRDARRLIDHEDAARAFRIPPSLPTLTDELAIPARPASYRVDKLIPTGGNVLLAAQFKAGKTTLVSNLMRALVDRERFLDQYDVEAFDGRVVMFNYEVDRDQYREWLRDIDITDTDHITVLPLRGYRLPLLVPHVEDWVVAYLKAADARVWIVDPFARAASGSVQSENDNTEVGAFLEALDVIKERAGVSELILPTHTGRTEHEQGEERARGATRLDDWADVRWLLTKDKNDTRYFRATGRDVEVDEFALNFDPATRRLTIGGGDRWTVERDALQDAVLTVVGNRPGVGARELRLGVRQIVHGAGNVKIGDAIEALTAARRMHTARAGHTVGHHVGPDVNQGTDDPFT